MRLRGGQELDVSPKRQFDLPDAIVNSIRQTLKLSTRIMIEKEDPIKPRSNVRMVAEFEAVRCALALEATHISAPETPIRSKGIRPAILIHV